MRTSLLLFAIFPSLIYANGIGSFRSLRTAQTSLPTVTPERAFAFSLAANDPDVNEDISWNSYGSYSLLQSYAVWWQPYRSVLPSTNWENEVQKKRATYIRMPDVHWISGQVGIYEYPLDTDGYVHQRADYNGTNSVRVVQTWETNTSFLQINGENHEVYANIIPSDTSTTEVFTDAENRVYVKHVPSSLYPNWFFLSDPIYRCISASHYGVSYQLDQAPALTAHTIAASISPPTQTLTSSKLIVETREINYSNHLQHITTHFDIAEAYSDLGDPEATFSAYRITAAKANGIAIDALGDLLPDSGTLLPWDTSLAGTYTGTLAEREGYHSSPHSHGILHNLTVQSDGSFSGLIYDTVYADSKPFRLKGKFQANDSTAVSVEIINGEVTRRGIRMAFFRNADGKIQLIGRFHSRDDHTPYFLAEKINGRKEPRKGNHTMVLPSGNAADNSATFHIEKNSRARFHIMLQDGSKMTASSCVSTEGLLPIATRKEKSYFVGRLRYAPNHPLGNWTGNAQYARNQDDEDNAIFAQGVCVGNEYRGWDKKSSPVTITIERDAESPEILDGNFHNNRIKLKNDFITLHENGALSSSQSSVRLGKAHLHGVALSSQHIFTSAAIIGGKQTRITVTRRITQ